MKINNITMTAEASPCRWLGCGIIFCVFFVTLYKIFMIAARPTLVICWWGKWYKSNQIKSDPRRALNTAYWVSSLSLLLSALSLFSEYRISPNKWQIVPDYLDSQSSIDPVSSPPLCGHTEHYSLDATEEEEGDDTAGLSPEERWEMREW